MFWVGWFGFNAGSALAADGSAGMATLVTHISAAVATTAWMCIEWIKLGKPSILGAVTGTIAGLGAITPASGNVGPLRAVVIGLTSAVVCFWAAMVLKQKIGYDDSLAVFGVHRVGGTVGTLLCGIFVAKSFGGQGLAEGKTIGSQFVVQIKAVIITILFNGIATFILLKIIDALIGLRASPKNEVSGLDIGSA